LFQIATLNYVAAAPASSSESFLYNSILHAAVAAIVDGLIPKWNQADQQQSYLVE
jgi:hypothetical protein